MAAKSNDQEGATDKNSNFGTLLILLSGLVLYADKVIDYFDIQFEHIPYYEKLDVFVWTIGNTISPLLLVAGYFFKPRKWALAAPGAAYSIQMMYIFRDVEWIGKDYFWLYSALFFVTIAVAIILLDYLVKNYRKTVGQLDKLKNSFLAFLLELKTGPIKQLLKTAIKKDLYDETYQDELKADSKAIDKKIKEQSKSILHETESPDDM